MCINWEAISAIATTLSTGVVALTILEMKKQRRATYLPQLHIHNKKFFIKKTKKGRPIFWRESNIKYDDKVEQSPDISIEVLNVGFAPAINVKIELDYDIDKMSKAIDGFKSIKLVKQKSDNSNSTIYMFDVSGNIWPLVLENENTIEYSVIKAGESIFIKLPHTIKNYINAISIIHQSNDNNYFDFEYKIPMIMKLRYKDISMKSINEDLFVYVKTLIINSEQDSDFIKGDISFIMKKANIL
jgi:hypothetical protein